MTRRRDHAMELLQLIKSSSGSGASIGDPTRWRRRVTAATDGGQARNAYRSTIQTPRSGRSPSPTPRRPSKNGARQSMLIAKPDASRSSWGADRRGTPAAHHDRPQRGGPGFFVLNSHGLPWSIHRKPLIAPCVDAGRVSTSEPSGEIGLAGRGPAAVAPGARTS
jgi:hypothetical protein